MAGLLLVVTLAAYLPALQAGFVWDDDAHVTENRTLGTLDGLRRIWFEPQALPQYYPLVHTTFWIEHHLWGVRPLGYHLVNVVLHALNALLLWWALEALSVTGAWFAAFLFALHPVHVESVAWITERKNVLSGFFYLAAALCLLRFYRLMPAFAAVPAASVEKSGAGPRPSDRFRTTPPLALRSATVIARNGQEVGVYAAGLAFYVLALLSKTVSASLPVALLIVLWWKRDRLRWRDLVPLVPLIAAGALLGTLTIWIEKHHVGAQGEPWGLSFLGRWLVAGRALWFYAGKLLWPARLVFFYPRWSIDPASWWQYLFPLAAAVVIAVLWVYRTRFGKGPLAAVLFFIVTLIPALGFFDVFPMRYSYVADHFQYLASIGPIALFAATTVTLLSGRRTQEASTVAPAARAPAANVDPRMAMAPSTDQAGRPRSGGRTPTLKAQKKESEPGSRALLAGARRSRVTSALLLFVLGGLTWGQCLVYKDLETLLRDTIAKNPGSWIAHNNLGVILAQRGETEQAISEYTLSLRQNPEFIEAHNNLGNALGRQGEFAEAAAEYAEAVRREPNYLSAQYSLGLALIRLGKYGEAVEPLLAALRIEPDFVQARDLLAIGLQRSGRSEEAIAQKAESFRFKAWLRATHEDPAMRSGREAIDFAEQSCKLTGYAQPMPLDALAAAYAEGGRFPEAVETAERALTLVRATGPPSLAQAIEGRLRLYEAGRPFRDTSLSRITIDDSQQAQPAPPPR